MQQVLLNSFIQEQEPLYFLSFFRNFKIKKKTWFNGYYHHCILLTKNLSIMKTEIIPYLVQRASFETRENKKKHQRPVIPKDLL